MKKAVIFPGVGYHTDKPLLYYSKKIAANYGYEVVEVPYGNFPKGVKGSKEKMEAAFFSALAQAEEILKGAELESCDDLLFISKSVGTAVASAYAQKHQLRTRNIYYTPVAASFQFMTQPGIVFHGTKDSWAETSVIRKGCEKGGFPLYITENANHSMETGNVGGDLDNLKKIMEITEQYIGGAGSNSGLRIHYASLDDLDAVEALEKAGFPPAEAGKREDFEKRILAFPRHFWLLEEDGKLVSMVNGIVTNETHLRDEMFENADLHDEDGEWQMLFGVVTDPAYQGKGYMSRLMEHVIEDVRRQGKKGLVLTCKDRLIPFYSRFGFVNEGKSQSEHGGAVWYEMRLTF